MIIDNGTIEIKRKSGGGIDPDTGYPTAPTAAWDAPIPCQYYANTYNNLGTTKSGEPFTIASYTILVEMQPLDGEQIRLTDTFGRIVGEFSIKEVTPLQAVGELKIIV